MDINNKLRWSPMPEILEDIRQGKMVIICDDTERENEGDLVMAAEFATPDQINFMVTEARGLVCASLTEEKAKKLHLTHMVPDNYSSKQTAFLQSIDIVSSTTGISTYERSATLIKLADDEAKAEDFLRPGHIFPLQAHKQGLIAREGHTEASVELMNMAKTSPIAVICEILNTDGSMSRRDDLFYFASKHNLKMTTVADIKEYYFVKLIEKQIQDKPFIPFPSEFGQFQLQTLTLPSMENWPYVILKKGDFSNPDSSGKRPLVRLHSECLTGDIFKSLRCDCRSQLEKSMKKIEEHGLGVILYLRQEGRGIGLEEKIRAYVLQDQGHDTVTANEKLGHAVDARSYLIAGYFLKAMNLSEIDLLTNNPLKISALKKQGIKVSRVSLQGEVGAFNDRYLQTKQEKLGHELILQ